MEQWIGSVHSKMAAKLVNNALMQIQVILLSNIADPFSNFC